MEIAVRKMSSNVFYVTIANKFFLTTLVHSRNPQGEDELKDWIHRVQKTYGGRKGTKQDVFVGIFSDRSINYKNPSFKYWFEKGSQKDAPYEALVLCVGDRCLIYNLPTSPGKSPVSKAVKDFLWDPTTVVVGAGIEKMAEKLREDFDFIITRRLELRDEAKKVFPEKNFSKSSLESLARVVLEGEVDVVKPTGIKWFAAPYFHSLLSDEMVGHATLDAFLAYQMGLRLLKESAH